MPPKKKDNLDDLKQELDIDFHKITSEELYQRFQTHPENVSSREVHKTFTGTNIFGNSSTGSESCKGKRESGKRWTKCFNTTKTNTRMGQVL